jgi:hypothetical protein
MLPPYVGECPCGAHCPRLAERMASVTDRYRLASDERVLAALSWLAKLSEILHCARSARFA